MRKLAVQIAAVATLLIGTGVAGATTLQDFVGGACIVDGDKEFCGIQGDVTGSGFYTPGSLADLNVNPLAGPATGIRINGSFSALGPGSVDVSFTYRVRVLDPSKEIIGVGLTANFSGVGTVLGNITEDVADGSNNPLASMYITVPPYCPGGCSANVALAGFQELIIDKDILLNAFTTGSAITLSIVDQTFEQTGVPEPASMALMGAGLLGVAVLRRRKA